MAGSRYYPRLGNTAQSQTIAAGTATSTAITNAFTANAIRISSVGAVRFRIGSTTTEVSQVAATDPLLPAASYEYLTVTPGQRISAIGDSVTTVLFVTEIV